VQALLAPAQVSLDHAWGLDHGTWSLLVHLFPNADVPVVQLAVDETLTASEHYDLARRLQPLRDESSALAAMRMLAGSFTVRSMASSPGDRGCAGATATQGRDAWASPG
jgi:aromatic ring-opening dioxygenase catalytic subunit (LigB family)